MAPPPVEMCEILSATPASSTAATESPPPTIVVAPASVAAATAFAMPRVPCGEGWLFEHAQWAVPDDHFGCGQIPAESSIVLGPMSRPIKSGGVCEMSVVFVSVEFGDCGQH